MTMASEQKSGEITILEVGVMWEQLAVRYTAWKALWYLLTMVNLAGDLDLKLIVEQGQTMLRKQIAALEKMAVGYAVPLPSKPPEATTPAIRQLLKQLIHSEIDVYEEFLAYGQLRGWVLEQPAYRA